MKANRQQLKGFLADGVITREEFDRLPADSLLRKVTGLMDDGQITRDELKSLGRGLMGGKGRGNGWFGKDRTPDRLADGLHERLRGRPSRISSTMARLHRRAIGHSQEDASPSTVAFGLRATPGLDANGARPASSAA